MRTYTITAGQDGTSGEFSFYIDGEPTGIEAEIIHAGSDSHAIVDSLSIMFCAGEIVAIEHDREHILVTTDEPGEGEAAE